MDTYRRHHFELIEELADMIWWTSIICGLAIPASELLRYPQLKFLCALILFPIWRLFWEILSWRAEVLILEETPAGPMIRKKWGVLRTREIKDKVGSLALHKDEPIWLRLIGAVKVHVTSASNSYIDARLMRKEFWGRLDRMHSGMKDNKEITPSGNTALDLVQIMPGLVNQGLVSPTKAQWFVDGVLEKTIA